MLNLDLKGIYYCATSDRRWGKGYTASEAKRNAGIRTKADENRCQFYVMAAVFDNPTDDELKNLFQCITADQFFGSPKYYDADRTEGDTAMIEMKHVGWLTVEPTVEKTEKKKAKK